METVACGLNWFGPFSNLQDLKDWESKEGNDTYLYLIRGKKKNAKKCRAFYVGQAFMQSAGKRMGNKHHHIEEVATQADHLCIYVAKFHDIKPSKKMLNVVENLFISFMYQYLVKAPDVMLNKTSFHKPQSSCYVVNNWYNPNNKEILHYKKDSFCKLIPDVICFYYETGAVYGAQRISFISELN